MLQDGMMIQIETLPPPVEGPAVWYGPEMVKRSDWVHVRAANGLTRWLPAQYVISDTLKSRTCAGPRQV